MNAQRGNIRVISEDHPMVISEVLIQQFALKKKPTQKGQQPSLLANPTQAQRLVKIT